MAALPLIVTVIGAAIVIGSTSSPLIGVGIIIAVAGTSWLARMLSR